MRIDDDQFRRLIELLQSDEGHGLMDFGDIVRDVDKAAGRIARALESIESLLQDISETLEKTRAGDCD